jgi:TolB protein
MEQEHERMKAWLRIVGLTAVAGLVACEPIDGIDLGGGGGTGGGAFSRGFVFLRDDGAAGRNVYAVDDTGDPNSPLQLTTQGGASNPTVAPSGQLVAFVHKVGSTTELQTVPTTGQGQPSTVFSSTECSGCGNFRYPTFSPDSRTIVFTLDQGGYAMLARVNPDGSGFQLLTPSGSYVYGAASFYPNGQSVLAAGGNAGTSTSQLRFLIQVNLESGTETPISYNLGNTAQVVVSRAVVSPDGTKVAFDGRTSNGSQVFVGQLGQTLSSVTQVTGHTGEYGVEDTWPSWRGNTELSFLSNSGGLDNIYRVSAAATGSSGSLLVPSALEPAYGGT